MTTRIALIGWGTGGHVTPIAWLVQYMREAWMDATFLWIGEASSMEERFARDSRVEFESITSYRIPSMRSWRMIPAVLRMARGFFEARAILKRFKPDNLFSKGGPGAISAVLAARSLKIPIYIHDSDVIPGISNRSIAKFADHVFLWRSEAESYFPGKETTVVGQLLSPKLLIKNPSSKISFRLEDKTRVLVICGSQGSKNIYRELIRAIPYLQDFEFIVSLGTQNENLAEEFSRFSNVEAEPWLGEDLGDLYRSADIIISRGGITTLVEAIAFGAKVIAIPLPIAAFDHQRANVRALEKEGLVIGLEESDISRLGEILEANKWRRSYTQARYNILDGSKKVSDKILRKLP